MGLGDFDFNLTDPGGATLGDMPGFNLSSPGGAVLDPSQFSLGGGGALPTGRPDTGGGGKSFFPTDLAGWGSLISPAKDLLGGALGVKSQIDNARYQKQLQDYYKQQSAQSAAYNAAMMDYLKQKQAYEGQMMGLFQEGFGQFQGALGDYQSQIQGIVDQEMQAAKPLLAQSQELIQPAVASLAKGEVPAVFEPVLEQVKQRLRAARTQEFAAAGRSPEEAQATYGDIDQQAQAMVIQQATAMLSGGQALGTQGLQFLGGATTGAQAGFSPYATELALLTQSLNGLLGGMPGLAPSPAPPAPVA
jgi:hypothetical protein